MTQIARLVGGYLLFAAFCILIGVSVITVTVDLWDCWRNRRNNALSREEATDKWLARMWNDESHEDRR